MCWLNTSKIHVSRKNILIKTLHKLLNQREHHKAESFTNEFRRLLAENEINVDEHYFMEV